MPKLKVKKCSYKDCSSTSNNTVDIQFFNFPKREERLEKWIHSCNNELLRQKSNQTLSSTFHVCSLHFKYNDFNRKISPFKTKLNTCSVPIPHNELTTIDAIDCAIGEIPNCNENSKIIISASQISDLCNVGKRKNIPDHVSLEEFTPKREFSEKTSPSLQNEISSSVKGLETLGLKKEVGAKKQISINGSIRVKKDLCQSFASTKENTATQSSEPAKNVSQPNIGKPAYLVVDDKYLLPIVTHSVKSCSDKHEVKDGPSSASLSSTGSAKGRKRKRPIIQSRVSLPSGSKRIMAFEKEGIKGKRALVTGGGSGIGLGIALKLVQKGAKVFIMGRNREKLENAVKESGNKIEALQVDVSDWTLTREAVQKILPIQLLVNNAGINVLKPVHEATENDFDTIINTNLKSAINLTQIVTQDLISRHLGGKVVNISSQGSSRALHNHLIYCSSKAALDMATKCFALELGPNKIRVNCVNPTVVLTELGRVAWSDGTKGAAMLNRIPQGRFAEVEEVVNAAIFLLSDKSDMVNGHCLAVDGGFLSS